MPKINNIVLVHGGFVDGSGWRGVYDILKNDGFSVSVVQNPTISLAGDVAATKLVIDSQAGPVILVGHSYGGSSLPRQGLTQTLRDWFTSPLSPRTRANQLIP
jgi:pimeloyl-ACP methyl ester carboxylesterase